VSARRAIVAGSLAAAAVLAAIFFFTRPSAPQSAALASRQQAMEMLGARIAQLRPDSKVLVLSNPFTKKAGYLDEKSQFERAGLRGLRQGLGGNASVTVVFPEIRPEFLSNPQSVPIPADSKTPLSFLMQLASVDQLAEAHPDHRVIVSLIGLPVGADRLKIWNEKDPRSFALLLPDFRVLGPPGQVVAAFQRGKLLAAVFEDQKSSEPLVVTGDNISEVLKQQPKTLGY
jgi:hypothetical protein